MTHNLLNTVNFNLRLCPLLNRVRLFLLCSFSNSIATSCFFFTNKNFDQGPLSSPDKIHHWVLTYQGALLTMTVNVLF